MKCSPLFLLVVSCLFFACQKSIDQRPEIQKKTLLTSKHLVKDLDSTVLTITLIPSVLCYSFTNGAVPRPCEVFVEIRCVLSKPVRAGITIEMVGSNTVTVQNASIPAEKIGVYIPPNMLHVSFNRALTNVRSQHIPDMYRINSVVLFTMSD